jgi:hypothetical protein
MLEEAGFFSGGVFEYVNERQIVIKPIKYNKCNKDVFGLLIVNYMKIITTKNGGNLFLMMQHFLSS